MKASNKKIVNLTTATFIEKSKKVHGENFSYPNAVFVNHQTKIEVHCNICNTDSMKLPASHLAGYGCIVCKTKERTHTKEKFVERAKAIHGDKYDYTNTVYTKSGEKSEIHCNGCNSNFMQAPKDHLIGRGCPICNKPGYKCHTTENFIEKAKAKYGEKFSYPNTIYTHSNNEIELHCNSCNTDFSQIACAFLSRAGCPSCIKKRKHDKFIKNAKKIHGDAYDYSNTVYESYQEPVDIHCNNCHEDFKIKPIWHLDGSGCKKCRRFNSKYAEETRKSEKENFIENAELVHGDQYDFSNTVYVNSYTELDILCKTCGETFSKKPCYFLRGKGCPQCPPKKKTQEFLNKSKELYGELYSFPNMVFMRMTHRVDIHCNSCNTDFRETPNNFFQGIACPICTAIQTNKTDSNLKDPNSSHGKKIGATLLTTDQFIERAKAKHGESFSYPNTVYTKSQEVIEIHCNSCNIDFTQAAHNFLNHPRCPSCTKKRKGERFLENAKLVHGDKYDYSKVKYEGFNDLVEIHCNSCHQDFMKKPSAHLAGYGCSECHNKLSKKTNGPKSDNTQN